MLKNLEKFAEIELVTTGGSGKQCRILKGHFLSRKASQILGGL